MVKHSQFVLDPLSAYYYKKKHPEYKDLPSTLSGTNKRTFKIVYPTTGSKIYLAHLNQEERTQVLFKVLSSLKTEKLYWHLNEELIATTTKNHEFNQALASGNYKLTIIDQQGRSESVKFEVVEWSPFSLIQNPTSFLLLKHKT